MKHLGWWMVALLGVVAGGVHAEEASESTQSASVDAAPADVLKVWNAWGGELDILWYRDLAKDYGLHISAGRGVLGTDFEGSERLQIRNETRIALGIRNGGFDGFHGGRLSVRGGFQLSLDDGSISMHDFVLRPRQDNRFVLDVVAGDGKAWFYVDRLMYELEANPPRLSVPAMDLRISRALAERLGNPSIEGVTIAAVKLVARVHAQDFSLPVAPKAPSGCGKWHGCEVTPGGPTYQADVFMEDFDVQLRRRSADSDGPGGADGRVVFTPNSTLKNNRNNNSSVATVPGDPLGTSSALHAANVPWHQKFTGNFDPHGNDQHPYLIWNLYRVSADGRISQVGRSGVKHAFLTINVSCDENPGNGHILGRGCSDTYAVSNNDSTNHLGPRNEIVPATGVWGRCGSVYDLDCMNGMDAGAPCNGVSECTTFFNRLAVRESQIDPGENAGATYLFESWYIVRDDINIFNTMQTRPASFSWTGTTWSISNGTPLRLGPAIDRIVPRGTDTPTTKSTDIRREEGEGRVVVRVTDLGGGQFRYDYAVMNFDFAEAVISGTNPNLRVESNDGFVQFRLVRPEGAPISALQFDDGDTDPGNDWLPTVTADSITWDTVAGSELNWGTLYSFSFVTNVAPVASELSLRTAQAGTPDFEIVQTLGPGGGGLALFSVGGTVSGVSGSDGVDLTLNGSETITRSVDGAFAFATGLGDGDAYSVAISRLPTGFTCDIANASGSIAGDDALDVDVVCAAIPPDQVTVGGALSGLAAGRSVGLLLNGSVSLTLSSDGSFVFPGTIAEGSAYAVTVSSQPLTQSCVVTNGSGTAPDGGVTDVQVTCSNNPITQHTVQATVSGLGAGRGVTLQLNGGHNLRPVANGTFVFGTTLGTGTDYSVTVFEHPEGQECTVGNGSGTIGSSNVNDVTVTCTDLPLIWHVGGTVSGLGAGQSVTLVLNGSESLLVDANGPFQFSTLMYDRAAYTVWVDDVSGPIGCNVSNASGAIESADVTSIAVGCEALEPQMFADGFEQP